MNENIKILELAKKRTIFDEIVFNDAEFCIKTRFLNAVYNRWVSDYTQEDVATMLNISKRSVSELENCKSNNLVHILNYIHHYQKNNAQEAIKKRKKRQLHYNYLN